MKHIFFIFALLLLVGCAAQTEVRPSEQTTKTTYISTLDKAIDESRAATEAKQNKGYKTILEINNKKAKVGDYVVFGILLNNLESKTDTFALSAEFWEARDSMNNKIETDVELVETWLQGTNFEPFSLNHGESKFIPIIIKIGSEIAPGVKTVKGSYKFIVKSYNEVKETSKKPYDTDKTLFVSVEP